MNIDSGSSTTTPSPPKQQEIMPDEEVQSYRSRERPRKPNISKRLKHVHEATPKKPTNPSFQTILTRPERAPISEPPEVPKEPPPKEPKAAPKPPKTNTVEDIPSLAFGKCPGRFSSYFFHIERLWNSFTNRKTQPARIFYSSNGKKEF